MLAFDGMDDDDADVTIRGSTNSSHRLLVYWYHVQSETSQWKLPMVQREPPVPPSLSAHWKGLKTTDNKVFAAADMRRDLPEFQPAGDDYHVWIPMT